MVRPQQFVTVTVEFLLEKPATDEDTEHYAEQAYQALLRHYEQVGFSRDTNGVQNITVSCDGEEYSIPDTHQREA